MVPLYPHDLPCQVYTELLGLTFERNEQLPVWHDEVKAFEVKEDGKAPEGLGWSSWVTWHYIYIYMFMYTYIYVYIYILDL